jgi:Tol biopolymer transport system component
MNLHHAFNRWRLVLALAIVCGPLLVGVARGVGLQAILGLTLDEGAEIVIPTERMEVVAPIADRTAIVYSLTQAPAHGSLKRSGVPLAMGDTFTQADVDNGQLRYAHAGGEVPTDTLALQVTPAITTIRASIRGTTQGTADSFDPALSLDGRFVAFRSFANNWVANDINNTEDVFYYNSETATLSRVSQNSDGVGGNSSSSEPAISADGRYVAFDSTSTNLLPGDTSGRETFLRDMQTGVIERVALNSNGEHGIGGGSIDPWLSNDARYVVFAADMTNLVPNDQNNSYDIFIRDRQTATTLRVSLVHNGGTVSEAANDSFDPVLSGNGRFVVFKSYAALTPDDLDTPLSNEDPNRATVADIYLHDRDSDGDGLFDEAGSTSMTLVSRVAGAAHQPGLNDTEPDLSNDGQYVVFETVAQLAAGDIDTSADVYRYRVANGAVEHVSVNNNVNVIDRESFEPVVSADGRYVGFRTSSSYFTVFDSSPAIDIYRRDMQLGLYHRVSVDNNGSGGGTGNADNVAIAADGNTLAFDSDRTGLINGDTNGRKDIFLHRLYGTLNASVPITVRPINDPPTLSDLADLNMRLNERDLLIPFTIGDPDHPLEGLSLTASSSNPLLVNNSGLGFGGSGNDRVLGISPQNNASGEAVVTITVSDGSLSVSKSFTLRVENRAEIVPPWLVLLYMAGDDIEPGSSNQVSLSEPLDDLLSRLNAMPANSAMRLLILKDGSANGDTKLFRRDPGDRGLVEIVNPSGWVGGFSNELNTGASATIRNFINWSRNTYPGSPNTMLSVIGHGGGWAPDFIANAQPRGRALVQAGGGRGLAIDMTAANGLGTSLSTRDTGKVFDGLGRFDVTFFDACLMNMIESAAEIQPYTDYFIAGQSLLWSQFPYEVYFAPENFSATTDAEALATNIVKLYNEPLRSDEPFTVSMLEMAQLPRTIERVNSLADALLASLPASSEPLSATNPVYLAIQQAYAATQKFDYDSSFRIDPTDAYVDLAHFATQLLQPANEISPAVDAAAQAVIDSVQGGAGVPKLVKQVKRNTGTPFQGALEWNFSQANGLSIYLPLGERDCRPSGVANVSGGPRAIAPCVAPADYPAGAPVIEPQLGYYVDASQLAFAREAPQWAALLLRLDSVTPNRDPAKPIFSPYQLYSEPTIPDLHLPMIVR